MRCGKVYYEMKKNLFAPVAMKFKILYFSGVNNLCF